MPKSKKGGPYPTHAKKSRRDEVFKLHFDYEYSARKIAEMMNGNRNTKTLISCIGIHVYKSKKKR